ncbi:helix-turn-helix transcriptional regulator [Phenylobacterium sp.]|jgi:hypothetical protein|uniref:helix-turn-helix domain-containing protein n=1 Tax=Phenylobacterium sp. TaxID=1871053 RepID=UPI002F424F1C
MGTPTHDPEAQRGWLSLALKGVRQRRGLRPPEVARLMGMPLRSFEYFEGGRGPLYVDRVHRFARALDADPHAILMAVEIGSPAFAARCSDNKLMTIAAMAIQGFDESTGEAISQLDAQTLRASFEQMFNELGRIARARAALASGWLGREPPTEDA